MNVKKHDSNQFLLKMLDEVKLLHLVNIELLLPVQQNINTDVSKIYELMKKTLMLAFDVPEECIKIFDKGIMERSLLALPNNIDAVNNRCNSYQLVMIKAGMSYNINNFIAYLFHNQYQYCKLSEEELENRKKYYEYISKKYKNIENYIIRLKMVLFMDYMDINRYCCFEDYKDLMNNKLFLDGSNNDDALFTREGCYENQ